MQEVLRKIIFIEECMNHGHLFFVLTACRIKIKN